MSGERKKLLWISISAVVVVLVLVAAGFFLFAPKSGGAQAPATVGNSAPPKAQDPQDFLASPLTTPSQAPSTAEQPKSQDGGMIIVYGDKPEGSQAPAAPAAAPAQAEGSGQAQAPAAVSPAPEQAPAATSQQTKGSTKTAPKASPKAAAAKGAASKGAAQTVSAKAASAKVEEYWIQTASFSSRGRADQLKETLAEKGLAALINVKDISGKSYYRVRIGPYGSKDEASDWLGRLKGIEGCQEAYVAKVSALRPKN